jgi:hypothetical protein
MHYLRDAQENFLIINKSWWPYHMVHLFGELKTLGISRSCTLGYVIIGHRVIHRNYVINSYSHMIGSYNLAQRSYSWIQHESII